MLARQWRAARWPASDRRGVAAYEYGLMVAIVAIGIVAALTAFGGSLAAVFSSFAAGL